MYTDREFLKILSRLEKHVDETADAWSTIGLDFVHAVEEMRRRHVNEADVKNLERRFDDVRKALFNAPMALELVALPFRLKEEQERRGRNDGGEGAKGGGGAKLSPAARRLGVKSYYTLVIPWEPDPSKRTEWHPTESRGPFKTLTRGTFASTSAAHNWARKHLGPGATYSLRKH